MSNNKKLATFIAIDEEIVVDIWTCSRAQKSNTQTATTDGRDGRNDCTASVRREREIGKQRGERDRKSEPYVELSFSHTDMCAYCKTYKNYKDIRYVQSINKTVLCSPCSSSSSGSSRTGKVTHKSWHKPYERNTFDLIQMRLGVGQEAQGGTGEQQQQEETKQALSAAVAGWDLCRATF